MKTSTVLLSSLRLFLLGGVLAPIALVASSDAMKDFRSQYHRPETIPEPADNIGTPEKIELGKMLFFDPRLSGSGAISCATCHNPSFAWGDGMALGRGHNHQQLGRRTPTVLNSAINELQMWDGRFSTLEEQAVGPMSSAAEMNIELDELVARLAANPGYVQRFEAVFRTDSVNIDNVAKAIAAFERTIISGEAPFDRFVAGDDDAISPAARRGFNLFNTKANCSSCHSGWAFTDSSFHDIGVQTKDLGRGATLGFDSLNHTFKTPGLRNIDQRKPYMHNGSEATLEEVVELYNQGGRVKRDTLSAEIKPLNLSSQEVADLVAFLHTLTSEDPPVTLPVLP